MIRQVALFGCLTAIALPAMSADKDLPSGFLCCNMRSNGKVMNDINYEAQTHLVPVGTTIRATGYGRYKVKVMVADASQNLDNDYSRDLSNEDFARRYIVAEDPKGKIAAFPKKIQDAIAAGRVATGMTREQVIMSMGYPVSSETADLNAAMYKYWVSSFEEYHVMFDAAGLVTGVTNADEAKASILAE